MPGGGSLRPLISVQDSFARQRLWLRLWLPPAAARCGWQCAPQPFSPSKGCQRCQCCSREDFFETPGVAWPVPVPLREVARPT